MRKATVYDVAAKAGVSTATVSFAFRQPDRVRPETRRRVLDAARELGYVPSASARGLARGSTGALGLYSFDMLVDHPAADEAASEPDVRAYPLYVDEVQRGFELECWHRNRAVLIGSGGAERGESVTDVAGRVDGLAVFPNRRTDGMPLDVLGRHVPLVRFSTADGDAPGAYVYCDNASGMRDLVDHLIDRHGVTDMAFVGALNSYDMRVRYDAFVARLGERGVAVDDRPLDDTAIDGPGRYPRLHAAAESHALPRALVCGNDEIALGVIDLLDELGMRVPGDVLVTGFDGILAGRLSNPPLTTVRQPMDAMGRLAARLLDGRDGRPWEAVERHELPVRLTVRRSCGC